MSTDQTPALARATEALPLRLDLIETLGRWVNDACATEVVDDGVLPLLRRRLHDPDDDVIARTIREHTARSPEWGQSVGCRCGWTPDWTGHASEETWVPWIEQHDRHQADAVRAALLGGDV